jgi:large subunit ribosomal protein L3
MSLGLLGKKIGMTRLFDQQAGSMIPVTVIDVSGNAILQVKTVEKDGYTALQIGFDDQKEQRVSKPDRRRSASSKSSALKKAPPLPKRIRALNSSAPASGSTSSPTAKAAASKVL